MRPSDLSAARLAELLARYPHEGNQALAAEFGLSAQAIAQIACNHHIHKTAAARSAINRGKRSLEGPSGTEQAAAAVKAAGEDGLSRAEAIAALPHLRPGAVSNALDCLTGRGHLHRAGRRGESRWYATAAWAEGAALGATAASPVTSRPARPSKPAAAAQATPGTPPRHTVAPTRPDRYTPAGPVLGVFSTLGPGQYADPEPRSWVAAITTQRRN